MEKMEKKISLWMPVTKDPKTGELAAVLTDTSVDRDDEAMDKDLIIKFSKNSSLKALANHNNSMQNWVGGWKKLKGIIKGNEAALFATPWFFSKEANPLAYQIERQVDESLNQGEHPGISIGAIVTASEIRKIKGKEIRVYTDGELLEGTWVPIQANRNASYGHIAKKFGMNKYLDNPTEDTTMEKTYTENEYNELNKQVKSLTDELSKAKDALKKAEEEKDSAEEKQTKQEEKTTESEKKLTKSVEKAKETEKELKELKAAPWYKGNFTEDEEEAEKTAKATADAIEKGALPVIHT